MSMEATVIDGDITLIAPEGAIDIGNSSALRDSIVEAATEGSARVLLDLAAVQYIDSSGLSALVASVNGLDKTGGKLALCSVDPSVLRVLELTRLDQFFTICEDRAAAESALRA